jgi:hypothetical protein
MAGKEKKDRKKFKDTKVGGFLADHSPSILETIGDFVPGGGLLDVAADLIRGSEMTEEQKAEAQKLLVEEYALEVQDRKSARERQVGIAEADDEDLMFNISGIVGLTIFTFLAVSVVFLEIPDSNREVWIHLIGIVEGVVVSIFAFFYGSAAKRNKNLASTLK